METITEKDGVFYYTNYWWKNYGCIHATIIGCEWIYNDKEMAIFQQWLDEKGETDD